MGEWTPQMAASLLEKHKEILDSQVQSGKYKEPGVASAILFLHRNGAAFDHLDFAVRYEIISSVIVSAKTSMQTGAMLVAGAKKELAVAMAELDKILNEVESVASDPFAGIDCE